MPISQWLQEHTQRTLDRLVSRLESRYNTFVDTNPVEWGIFLERLQTHFGRLFSILLHLYKDHYDFFYYLEELLVAITQFWIDRPTELKSLDIAREANLSWYHDHQMLGGVCYADLYAGDLGGFGPPSTLTSGI